MDLCIALKRLVEAEGEKQTDVTKTPAFSAWFGSSKVVDAQGKPLVVYHGSGSDFSEFKNMPTGAGSRESPLGFWFTNDTDAAGLFSVFAARGDGANIKPVYLNMKKPFVAGSYQDIKDVVDANTKFYHSNEIRMAFDKVDYESARKSLTARGYDGIILKDTIVDSPDGKTKIDQYVVFSPTQIKSAIGNKGTFDQSNPNMNESLDVALKKELT